MDTGHFTRPGWSSKPRRDEAQCVSSGADGGGRCADAAEDQSLGQRGLEDDAKTLVQRLEYIPLAITHVAAYLAVRVQTITVSTYLRLFHESEENQAHLLSSQEPRDIRRDGSVTDAVITTWQISFEQIRKTRPEAAELLSLMAMFDGQGIPESILYNGRGRLQFEDAVAPLTSFSLIKAQSTKQPEQQVGEHMFEMHDLVQLATRKWLEVQMQVGRWQKASLRIIAATFPSGQHETWAACRVLLPHARKVLSYVLEETEAILDRATIADNTVWYLLLAGEYAAAEKIGRTAVVGREKVLGVEHPDTLTSVNNLGLVLSRQGKYEEAEAMHRRDLHGSEVLGIEHPHTLTSVGNLGSVLWSQGKYEEAEAMHRRALEGSEKVLGVEHPDTLTSMANLASTLWSQRQWKEAEDLEMQVMETRQRVLGHEHPHTLMAMDNLAFTLKSQSRNKETISLMETCFQLQEPDAGEEGRGKKLKRPSKKRKRPSTPIQQLSPNREEGFRDAEKKAEDITAADDEDFISGVGKGINIPERRRSKRLLSHRVRSDG